MVLQSQYAELEIRNHSSVLGPPRITLNRNSSRRSGDITVPLGSSAAAGVTQRQAEQERQINLLREKRVLTVVFLVVFNFLVCLLPYALYASLWLYGAVIPDMTVFTVTQFLMYAHPALDPIVLVLTNAELRPDFCKREAGL